MNEAVVWDASSGKPVIAAASLERMDRGISRVRKLATREMIKAKLGFLRKG